VSGVAMAGTLLGTIGSARPDTRPVKLQASGFVRE
jgi:hypothetical protein